MKKQVVGMLQAAQYMRGKDPSSATLASSASTVSRAHNLVNFLISFTN